MIVIGGGEDFGKTNAIYKLSMPSKSLSEKRFLSDDLRWLLSLDTAVLERTYDLKLTFSHPDSETEVISYFTF